MNRTRHAVSLHDPLLVMNRFSLFLLLAALVAPATAQTAHADETWYDCANRWTSDGRVTYCEVREVTLAPRRLVRADAGANGGIRVEAWDRDEVLLRALVPTQGRSEAEARRVAERVAIDTDGTLRARVPESRDQASVSVSFMLLVPRASDLDLETNNGGIEIEGVSGEIRFAAQNGGVSLEGVGGDVRGRTTNGGLHITLTGDRWDGTGLDAQTTNGGVRLIVPDGYSADLETGTTNGRLRLDFPLTMQSDIERRVPTTLGDGGPPVRAVTTNGGVRVERG